MDDRDPGLTSATYEFGHALDHPLLCGFRECREPREIADHAALTFMDDERASFGLEERVEIEGHPVNLPDVA